MSKEKPRDLLTFYQTFHSKGVMMHTTFGPEPKMTIQPNQIKHAGETIDYTITYLEMTERPSYARPHMFDKTPSALIRAASPPNWYFLNLYDAVGRNHEWQDMHALSDEELGAYLRHDHMQLFTYLRNGWPHGFFMLDNREAPAVDLAYFGLVPEAIGQGLGTYLIQTAIHMGWDIPGTERMTIQTCTLDHPRALALYQKHGFKPIAQETKSRVLTMDWDPSGFP